MLCVPVHTFGLGNLGAVAPSKVDRYVLEAVLF